MSNESQGKSNTENPNPKKSGSFFSSIKRIVRRAFILSALCVAAFVLFVLFLDEVIVYAINHSANYADLNAKVEDVDVHIFTQRIVIKDISLKNPDGFPEGNAFQASKLTLKFDFLGSGQLLKRIYLQNAKIRIEGRSGRRIMAKSVLRSNIFVLARELGRAFGVKIEYMLFGNPKERAIRQANFEDESSGTGKPPSIRDCLKIFSGLDEVRLENLAVENGKDLYSFGSVICNDKVVLVSNFRSTLFGVNLGIRNIFFDTENLTAGFMGLGIRNPEGYLEKDLFSIKEFRICILESEGEDGGFVHKLKSVDINSPIAYLEDKHGSMLGAIGMENNFAELFNTVNSMNRMDLNSLFQDEFESVPKEQEFKLPEFVFDDINIVNARIVCKNKDAGLLANKIAVSKNLIDIDDIRAHIGGVKLELEGVDIDSEKQLFSANNFSILNPAGFPEENAFRFKNFKMSTNFSEKVIRGNRVAQIDFLEVDDFFVRLDSRTGDLYDLIGDDNNLYALLDAVDETAKSMPVYRDSVQKQINENSQKRPYRYTINSVKFTGGKIFIGPRGDAIKIPFANVEHTDLGVNEKGLTSQEMTTVLMKDIIINAIDGAQDKVSEEIGGVLLAPAIRVLRTIVTLF